MLPVFQRFPPRTGSCTSRCPPERSVQMVRTTSSLTLLVFVVAACSRPDEQAGRDSAVDTIPRPAAVPVVEFDPITTHAGDMVMALNVDSIAAQRTPSGEIVGMARFSGSVLLSGHTFQHPDGADYRFPCFEADSASARRLPRWAGDTRRPWFCFENGDEATKQFGGAAAGIPATIRVTRFTIHRNLSDAVNSARLIEIVSRDSLKTNASRCFSTAGSVLGRAAGTAAPAPRDVTGWIRIDGLSAATDSGTVKLVDSDGRSLDARWRRVSADSVAVVGFNDFVRVEMRLSPTPNRLSGSAVASSDAAATRDSAGQLKPLRRQWAIDGSSQPCDSLPRERAS